MKREDSFAGGEAGQAGGAPASKCLAMTRNPKTPLSPAARDGLVRLTFSGDITQELRAAIEREIAQSDALIGSIAASEWMKQSNLG